MRFQLRNTQRGSGNCPGPASRSRAEAGFEPRAMRHPGTGIYGHVGDWSSGRALVLGRGKSGCRRAGGKDSLHLGRNVVLLNGLSCPPFLFTLKHLISQLCEREGNREEEAAAENQRQIFSILRQAGPGHLRPSLWDSGWWFTFPKNLCFWSPGYMSGGLARIPPTHTHTQGLLGAAGHPSKLAQKWKFSSWRRGQPGQWGSGGSGSQEDRVVPWSQLFILRGPPLCTQCQARDAFHIKIGAVSVLLGAGG